MCSFFSIEKMLGEKRSAVDILLRFMWDAVQLQGHC